MSKYVKRLDQKTLEVSYPDKLTGAQAGWVNRGLKAAGVEGRIKFTNICGWQYWIGGANYTPELTQGGVRRFKLSNDGGFIPAYTN